MRFGWLFGLGLAITAGVASASEVQPAALPREVVSATPVRGSFEGSAPRRLGMHGLIDALRAHVSRDGVEQLGFSGFVPDGTLQDVSENFVVAGVGDPSAGAELTRSCDALTDAVVGIHGRADQRVRSLGLICAPIGPAGAPLLAQKYETASVGGSRAGSAFYDLCPSGRWLTGFQAATQGAQLSGLSALCAPLEHSVE